MSTVGSYEVSSFAAGTQAEIKRLNAQVDLFWESESELLQRHGLRNGMEVLDCGCGPGRLIERLKGILPGLRCTGLEIDPLLVAEAQRRFAAHGFRDCRVIQGAAEESGLPEKSFDFIILRLVLEHVPDPVRALQQLGALLRPWGRLVVIANDFEFHLRTWPPVPQLDQLYEAYCASRRRDGGDPCIGRRLPLLFAQSGLRVVAYQVEVAHNQLVGDRPFLQAEGVGIPAQLVKDGFLAQPVFEDMMASWQAMLRDPQHCFLRPLFVAVGEPAGGEAADSDRPLPSLAVPAVPPPASEPGLAALPPEDLVAPSGELERQVAEIWGRILGLARVGITHNFFDLGGDSLAFEQVKVELKTRLGFDIPVATLFQYPTIQTLAGHLAAGSPGSPSPSPGEDQEATEDQRWAARRRGALRRARSPEAN